MPITVEDDVETDKVGGIIGSKGSTIGEIIKKSGCKVNINQDFPKGMPHKIIYVGKKFILTFICSFLGTFLFILMYVIFLIFFLNFYFAFVILFCFVIIFPLFFSPLHPFTALLRLSPLRLLLFPLPSPSSGQKDQIESARAMVQLIKDKGPQALQEYGSMPSIEVNTMEI